MEKQVSNMNEKFDCSKYIGTIVQIRQIYATNIANKMQQNLLQLRLFQHVFQLFLLSIARKMQQKLLKQYMKTRAP